MAEWLVSVYEELWARPDFCPELQLVIVIGKILGFRNCLRTASYTGKYPQGGVFFLSHILYV
jgi:hypothetical protein